LGLGTKRKLMGTMRTSWEQEEFDRDCLRTWWEQKDFDGFIDGNKKKIDENYLGTWCGRKICYFCYLGRKILKLEMSWSLIFFKKKNPNLNQLIIVLIQGPK
jgi:hypothetical protein